MTAAAPNHFSKLFANIKWAFTTRRVSQDDATQLLTNIEPARAGDLLLAEVKSLGQHKKLRLTTARQSDLYAGDHIVVSVGARYAPDQFEASADIETDRCHLIAAGGVAGRMLTKHEAMSAPTSLRPLGLLADHQGRVLNLSRYGLPERRQPPTVPLIAVIGTAMNAGKTTTVAGVVHGLTRAGYKVGAAKVTGTGGPLDFCAYLDAGAFAAVDFTDAGYASTYQTALPELEQILFILTGHLQEAGCDAIVLEVADGIFQTETAALIYSKIFRDSIDAVLFAAPDALSAIGGVNMLRQHDLPVIGVSGLISRSPLACQEAATQLSVPVLGCAELHEPARAHALLDRARQRQAERSTVAPLAIQPQLNASFVAA